MNKHKFTSIKSCNYYSRIVGLLQFCNRRDTLVMITEKEFSRPSRQNGHV